MICSLIQRREKREGTNFLSFPGTYERIKKGATVLTTIAPLIFTFSNSQITSITIALAPPPPLQIPAAP